MQDIIPCTAVTARCDTLDLFSLCLITTALGSGEDNTPLPALLTSLLFHLLVTAGETGGRSGLPTTMRKTPCDKGQGQVI